jgi:hypothetical protein
VGGGGYKERKGVGGRIWKYYVLMYEDGKMRSVETVLRMGRGKTKENNEGDEFKKYHKHFCKCHSVPQ